MYKKLIFPLLFLISFTNINIKTFSQDIDIDILKKINIERNKKLDNTFNFFSNSVYILSPSIPIGLFLSGYILEEDSLLQSGFNMGVSIFSVTATSLLLKNITKKQRPYDKYSTIDNVIIEKNYSMPSSHTAIAFSTATYISLYYPKWYIIIPSYLWATTVAYSRLHLGVHYPSDVIVGAIIGSGISYLSYRIQKYINEKKTLELIKL